MVNILQTHKSKDKSSVDVQRIRSYGHLICRIALFGPLFGSSVDQRKSWPSTGKLSD